MTERIRLEVQADELERLARSAQPHPAIAELVWNSLDAEAERVAVTIQRSPLGAIVEILVTDDGHGMTYSDAADVFRRLGGSWKRLAQSSKNGKRALHGNQGDGRFRAFALGRRVEWDSVAVDLGGQQARSIVTASLESPEFLISGPMPAETERVGTTVRITDIKDEASRLLAEGTPNWFVARFAVYLIKYPTVNFFFDEQRLDPRAILAREHELALNGEFDARFHSPILHLFEWMPTASIIKPSLILCGSEGIALDEITEDLPPAGAIRYTGYLLWQGFADNASDIQLAEMSHPVFGPPIAAAKASLEAYIQERLAEQRTDLVDQWKAQNIYPYTKPAVTEAERQERRLFDVVAVAAAPALPQKDVRSAKLSLRLLREALETSPASLERVLQEVLDLTPEQLEDFNRLLDRTTLASVIQTTRIVTGRLDFLHDLEGILFDFEKRKRLRERSQLHKILENGKTWVFGEDYLLAVSDQGLTRVLEEHRKLLGETTKRGAADPVRDVHGSTAIVDLMLSKVAEYANGRHHLVVELKRPSARLSHEELGQMAKYAAAVAADQRFKSPDVSWDFWLVGNDMDPVVHGMVHQEGRPVGLYQQMANYRIWVRLWAEVLEENRRRLHFYRDNLAYQPSEDEGFEATINKYLAPKRPAGAGSATV